MELLFQIIAASLFVTGLCAGFSLAIMYSASLISRGFKKLMGASNERQ